VLNIKTDNKFLITIYFAVINFDVRNLKIKLYFAYFSKKYSAVVEPAVPFVLIV
jgi:hypothetical protein